MKKSPKNLHESLNDPDRVRYKNITLSEIEKAIAELYKSYPDTDDSEVVDLIAIQRTDEQVERIVADPNSPYHKILSGYMYSIDGSTVLYTGKGGAQMMYKAFLKQGMSEDMVQTLIYVHIDNKGSHPLANLNVTKTNNE